MVVPLIVACALFMQNLDTSIINTALPSIALSFHDSPVRLSLAVTAYMLSLAVFIPVSGWMADRFGAASVFRAAIALFTLSSMACGLCNSSMELTAARIVQGIGGAMMVPVGRLVLLRSIDRSELVRAISYLTTPAILGPILGPPIGGLITTYLSWRWVFYLNVPVGVLGIVLVTHADRGHQARIEPAARLARLRADRRRAHLPHVRVRFDRAPDCGRRGHRAGAPGRRAHRHRRHPARAPA